jgi:hypothetical protein
MIAKATMTMKRVIMRFLRSQRLFVFFALVATVGSTNVLAANTASFIGTDLVTQGNWKSVYGSDGYAIISDSTNYPAYAQVLATGKHDYVWAAQPDTDPRALQRGVAAGRIAATWFSSTSFAVDVNVTDGNLHNVALYNLDWDSTARAQRVDILDGNSGSVLDSRTVTGFNGGQYLIWTVSGHITIRITRTAGDNAVLSGLFFGTAGATLPPTITRLSSSANPAVVGTPVTLTATVTGTSPSGSVNLADNGNPLAGCTSLVLTGSGNVSTTACTTSSLAAGTHSIVANYSGDAANQPSSSAVLAQVVTTVQVSKPAVTTYHNDVSRTGTTLSESILNTSNVNIATFGKLVSHQVDGKIYAQILYVPDVTIPGNGLHNVVYVSTLNNSVYAFDADNVTTSDPLWHVNLGPTVPVVIYYGLFTENIGILSTPVIDAASQTLFVVAETSTGSNTIFQLHALDLTTGKELFNGPATISGSVQGTGAGSVNGLLNFAPEMHLQRPGLLLLNGNVYISFGSHDDMPPWHGWMFSYNMTSLQRTSIMCMSPTTDSSAIWQGGVAPTADASGNIYVITGNGPLDATTGGQDFGDSFVKLSTTNGLKVLDYFSPSNQAYLDAIDGDLGSGGPLLIPGTSLLVGGGKDGRLFLVDSNNMGEFSVTDRVVQKWGATNGIFSGNVYYNSRLYVWGQNDALKVFAFNGSTFNTTPVSQGTTLIPFANSNEPAMSLSANGLTTGTGIIWATYSENGLSNGGQYPGILRAFDATDVTHELWNSDKASYRDAVGSWAKWSPPTIANGKVYLGTFDNVFQVYGLRTGNTPTAVVSFIGTDLVTQGNWKSVYGSDGYAIISDNTNYPAYAQVLATGKHDYVWAAQPDTDPRALQRGVATGRIAATWSDPTSFNVEVNLTDGNPHDVALYNLDWDSNARAQRVDILDWNSGSVLDSRIVTGFNGGQYLIWTVRGHITIRITRTAGANAVLSGIFFDVAQ